MSCASTINYKAHYNFGPIILQTSLKYSAPTWNIGINDKSQARCWWAVPGLFIEVLIYITRPRVKSGANKVYDGR